MSPHSENSDLELICVIVNFGLGSKVIQTAKKCGISGATVLLGRGTVRDPILEFLSITDVRKEIILLVTDKMTSDYALAEFENKFRFTKPNHGIAFRTSVVGVLGASSFMDVQILDRGGADAMMYHAIMTIVDKGNAEYVIDAAKEAGAKGGTIINGRGSGIHEVSKVLSMDIEPEKEIVLILSKKESTETIVNAIRNKLKIDEPGNGIIFIQDVNATYGLRE